MEREAASSKRYAGQSPRSRGGNRPRISRASLLLTLANCALIALLVSPGGPGLVTVHAPLAGEVVGVDGVGVVVRIPADGRADAESLRVLLNGADVTGQLIRGQNGAVGRLHGLLDGENVLAVEVEGPSWWLDGRAFASRREVRFLARRPLHLDRG